MYVHVNGTRLFFDVAGPGLRPCDGVLAEVPTLLILHGGPGSDHSAVKAPLLPLADRYQLVWIDHRGNGRSARQRPGASGRSTSGPTTSRRFCDALGIVKPDRARAVVRRHRRDPGLRRAAPRIMPAS